MYLGYHFRVRIVSHVRKVIKFLSSQKKTFGMKLDLRTCLYILRASTYICMYLDRKIFFTNFTMEEVHKSLLLTEVWPFAFLKFSIS